MMRKAVLLTIGWMNLLGFSMVSTALAETMLLKAFPSAEGFGAHAEGGRGGVVYHVVNLHDAGPGSLRACIEASGPRTCVFRVGGEISLQRTLAVTTPYLTIAGQTAPGSGILLRNAPGNPGATLSIRTHDVIVRHLRIRPGASAVASSIDALQIIRGAKDVIIDHASLSWSVDENLDMTSDKWLDPRNITVQWSIIAEGLDRSLHASGKRHSKGILLSSGRTGFPGENNFTIHHNLIAHNRDRMPEIDNVGITDVVNNVFYNARSEFGEFKSQYGQNKINYVGNYVKFGPSTSKKAKAINIKNNEFPITIYSKGNIVRRRGAVKQPLGDLLDPGVSRFLHVVDEPVTRIFGTSAENAYRDVLDQAGATLPARDAVDARIVLEVRRGEGQIIDDPMQVGGYPAMADGPVAPDSDLDGMPDRWELRRGLDPMNPADRNHRLDHSGYTALEHYLNELAGDYR